jgi:hypothetical protein
MASSVRALEKAMTRTKFLATIVLAAGAFLPAPLATAGAQEQDRERRPRLTAAQTRAPADPAVRYRNCAEAWAAGAAPIRRGAPGYAPHLDGDLDGIACEPIRARR